MGNAQTEETKATKPLRPHIKRTTDDQPGRGALLLGASGATGKFVLSYLIRSPEWSKITIIHRREIDLNEISKQSNIPFTDQQKSKVIQHTVNMEKLCENDETITKNVELFKDHDITICTLGTTRAKAVSAENFRKVDLYMVRDGGILSSKAGIKHFSLLTSKAANANIWANDWKLTHGLLYLKTKGDAEQCIIKEKFMKRSIFRPGLLDRDATGTSMKLSVRDLAGVMVYDAESDDIEMDEKKQDVIFYEGDNIDKMLVMARKNYNDVCNKGDMKKDNKETKIDDNDKGKQMGDNKESVVEDENKNNENDNKGDVIQDKDKDDKGKDEVINKGSVGNVSNESNDDITPKYEVIEKPDDDGVEAVEQGKKGDEEVVKDEDYVEVDKGDMDKNTDVQ